MLSKRQGEHLQAGVLTIDYRQLEAGSDLPLTTLMIPGSRKQGHHTGIRSLGPVGEGFRCS